MRPSGELQRLVSGVATCVVRDQIFNVEIMWAWTLRAQISICDTGARLAETLPEAASAAN